MEHHPEQRAKVPPILHQIWLQGECAIPERYRAYQEHNQYMMRHWRYEFWDEQRIELFLATLDRLHHVGDGDLLERYRAFPYLHERVDFARYVFLAEMGGVYVDMDAKIVRSLDDLLLTYPTADLIVGITNVARVLSYMSSGSTETINNGIIVAAPRTDVLRDVVRRARPVTHALWQSTKATHIDHSTGPSFFTPIIREHISAARENIVVLETDVFEPCSTQRHIGATEVPCDESQVDLQRSYIVHDGFGNWAWEGISGNVLRLIARLVHSPLLLVALVLLLVFSVKVLKRKYQATH